MRIAFLAPANSIHTQRWVTALIDRKIDVTLFSMREHRDLEFESKLPIKIVYLSGKLPFGYYTAAIQLMKYLKNNKYSIVNAHYASGYGTLARLAKAKPLLLNVWGSDVYEFPNESNFKKKILVKNLRYANKIASTSNIMAKQIRQVLNSKDLLIEITPFGVDTVKQFFPRKHIKKHASFVIGIVKTLEEKYGITYLIDAFALLCKQWGSENLPVLHICGRGEQLAQLQEQAANLAVKDNVIFKGYIHHDEVPNALAEMDLFVAASDFESFGVAVVEAMAMGLPVVATDADGFTEVIKDGITGLIVPKKNTQALAQAMLTILQDSEHMKKMGIAGRERAVALYDWNSNVDDMIGIYKKMNDMN